MRNLANIPLRVVAGICRAPCRIWQHRKLRLLLFLLFTFACIVNILAYLHAHAMTHFVAGGTRTGSPEQLSLFAKARILVTGISLQRPENGLEPDSVNLPFTIHCFTAADGLALEAWHVERADAKGLVLLFHGYGASRANLLREAKAFHDMGYAALLIDFRGCGGSVGNVTTIGVREADDVAGAVSFAQARWPDLPLILYGQSMGSVAVLRAVSVHALQPRAIVIECPFNKLLATVENRFDAMRLPSFPAAHLLVFWGGVQHGFNGFHHNCTEYACDAQCPVLLLHGAADPRVSREQVEEIFANLPGEKKLHLFEGVGHESYVSARAQQWSECVAEFLKPHVPR